MIEEIRTRVQPLYDTKELLGFSVFNDHGDVIHNESFLCDDSARASASVFMGCRKNMLNSGRKLKRFIVELDDIILIYCLTQAGHTVFTLDRDCDLDAAASLLTPA